MRSISPGVHNTARISILNSGMLIDTRAFRETGGYDDNIPLYFSDFAFMDRYRRLYDSICVVDAECRHDHFFDDKSADTGAALERFGLYCRGRINYSRSPWSKITGFLLNAAKAGRWPMPSAKGRSLAWPPERSPCSTG